MPHTTNLNPNDRAFFANRQEQKIILTCLRVWHMWEVVLKSIHTTTWMETLAIWTTYPYGVMLPDTVQWINWSSSNKQVTLNLVVNLHRLLKLPATATLTTAQHVTGYAVCTVQPHTQLTCTIICASIADACCWFRRLSLSLSLGSPMRGNGYM